ncbi:hypothetical protein BHU72_14755 [Desulfuribacillus stibiiarsenatis]|uniref:Uncharacterized protein n=1 Tax=Desulfuribacillus stibiiarsenatis TaxID=1390249 RepID=A0A1E5L781_9FIRM|nr:hypothetical protein [Desulfuribacillus stibiiarsenatis]OEH86010.1 hypothetical protein BHU72_14755 [Desulfuribacillus stibiiarsenatis]
MYVWLLSAVIAIVPYIPWGKLWKQILLWLDEFAPNARDDIEYRVRQAQLSWVSYESLMFVLMVCMGMLIFSWFVPLEGYWRYLLIIGSVTPWYLLKWWGNVVKDEVRIETANFYRAFTELMHAGAQPDEALRDSIKHVNYLKHPLERILDNWGNTSGIKEVLHDIYSLYEHSDVKNMCNFLSHVILLNSNESLLNTMKSQEELIRELREHSEETRDQAEESRLETASTFVVLAQLFLVILPIVMDVAGQMRNITN